MATFRLDGRAVVVTGASSGLGARFARALDGAGARLVLAARRIDRLEALAGELRDAIAVRCDLARSDEPSALVATALERFGQIDVLVNNAGTTETIAALEEPVERFREVLDVNLVAPFALAQAAARSMVDSERGGTIVNVASIWGVVGVGQIPAASYAASKGGLVNLTRELAAQWGRQGVRVNALAPGWFRSEMTEATMFEDERGQQWVRRGSLLARGGEEHELDGALLFLASDASSYVTGQVLCVDGGWTAV